MSRDCWLKFRKRLWRISYYGKEYLNLLLRQYISNKCIGVYAGSGIVDRLGLSVNE